MASATEKSASDVFEPLVEEGEGELGRKTLDLVLSGLIAGLDIGFGPLAMGVLAGRLHVSLHVPIGQALLFSSILYPLGFVFVIAGRSELYTENTLTPVAGALSRGGSFLKVGRRWTIVLVMNIIGAILFSLLASHTSVVFDPYKGVYRAMAMNLVAQPFGQAVLAGVLAGWLVALLAWLMQATEGSTAHFLITFVIAYILVALSLYHCVIGSIEVLMGMFAGAPITWGTWLTSFLIPAVIGNTVGAVGIVTILKGAQARSARRP